MNDRHPQAGQSSTAVIVGDCLEAMRQMTPTSVDAIVTDPPYGLGFMGKTWDDLPPGLPWARECLRVLKPGGHLLAFGGTRTSHRMVCAIEDAGFEIRDTICWLYGSGFPKSLDVGKAIDKAAGAERRVVGPGGRSGVERAAMAGDFAGEWDSTAPATPDAERWQGWGTALKPAHEPIVVARKPLAGTVSANILAHGTGALNVDGCRIPTDPDDPVHKAVWTSRSSSFREGGTGFLHGTTEDGDRRAAAPHSAGRWPANVVLDEEAAAALDAMTGELTSGANPTRRGSDKSRMAYGDFEGQRECKPARGADAGGASRFFYVAKASSAERNAGLLHLVAREREGQSAWAGLCNVCGSRMMLNGKPTCGHDDFEWVTGKATQNTHPTVKPVDLMRWLVRLVTPPGGLVLDPFTGSGTTGCACAVEGVRFVGIEREAEYAAIAEARIAWWTEHGAAAIDVARRRAESNADPDPQSLFESA